MPTPEPTAAQALLDAYDEADLYAEWCYLECRFEGGSHAQADLFAQAMFRRKFRRLTESSLPF